jgi:hypothetical protein
MKQVTLLATFFLLAAQAQDIRVPVIVELFTSEGCSSCPPADTLLSRLERAQPVAGAQIIALEEHVDYWNHLGWVDPFSSPQYRVRQNDYAQHFFLENVFTPQMVVNGQAQFTGNDGARALQEIGRAAQMPNVQVGLKTAADPGDPELLNLFVQVTNLKTGKARAANVYLAITENELVSNVQRGENSGRQLRHAPVVRSFGVIGKIQRTSANAGQIVNTLRFPHDWRRENLRAVVFVQELDGSKITGAATIDLH